MMISLRIKSLKSPLVKFNCRAQNNGLLLAPILVYDEVNSNLQLVITVHPC